jgi:hypothetical protein
MGSERDEMPTLEQRVTALETRVDELATQNGHTADLAVVAGREALTAREAHQKNIELLNALRKTQAEQSKVLADHTKVLADHTQRLNAIDSKLGGLAVGMHTIERLLTRLVDDEGAAGDS